MEQKDPTHKFGTEHVDRIIESQKLTLVLDAILLVGRALNVLLFYTQAKKGKHIHEDSLNVDTGYVKYVLWKHINTFIMSRFRIPACGITEKDFVR